MKFYRHLVTAGALGALVVVSACSDEQGPSSDGAGIEIQIAPVVYSTALDVCWGFAVHNPAGQLVAEQQNICAGRYGNREGGDIGYVIPCDASQEGDSTVTLWLEYIRIGGTVSSPVTEPESAYINPCGLTEDLLEWDNILTNGKEFPPEDRNYDKTICQKKIQCEPNADKPVRFNLTIMRDAQQGFFDMIVDFDEIYCSAKLDTCYQNGEHINLLFDMDGQVPWDANDPGPRDDTAVIALACTAGPETWDAANNEVDEITTTLHYSNVAIICRDGTDVIAIPIDPTGVPAGGAGNQVATQYVEMVGGVPSGPLQDLASVVNYALYWGKEALPCGSYDPDGDGPQGLKPLSCNKKYWNIAINLEDLEELGFTNCTLQTQATATGSDGLQLVNGGLDGDGVSYAAINFQEEVIDQSGASTCNWNPLNGADKTNVPKSSGVQTAYVGTGDILGLEKLHTMCYWKNTENDGDPDYTTFIDRYDSYEKGRPLGRLGTKWESAVGGAHGRDCYRGTADANAAVANATEAAIWTVQSGVQKAGFAAEKGRAGSDTVAVEVWGYNATGWALIQEGLTLFQFEQQQKEYPVFGVSRIALVLRKQGGESIDFSINSTAITIN